MNWYIWIGTFQRVTQRARMLLTDNIQSGSSCSVNYYKAWCVYWQFLWYMRAYLDCKAVRIFAYSSTREQSNKRSGMRLKTESETGERLLRHALPISLLILRKKPTVLPSRAYLKDKGTVNSFVTEITIKQTLLQFLFLCGSSIPLKLGHLVPVWTVSI